MSILPLWEINFIWETNLELAKMIKYRIIKRICDLFFSILFLILLSPFLSLILFIVFLGDFENPLYFGKRVGRREKNFFLIKIRTMKINSEYISSTTSKNDPRITKIGKYLRLLKIDELTNLINIIRGEMSFVGPRPEIKEYVDLYTNEEKDIFDVYPGITDYASLKYISLDENVGEINSHQKYIDTVLKDKNSLRLKYARGISFFTDLYILLITGKYLFSKIFKLIRKDF